MSRFKFGGNEIIPGTITITADNFTITPKDDLRVILNISGGGSVTVDDGSDVTQRIEIMNLSGSACNVTYQGNGASVTFALADSKGMRMLWVGSYWTATISGLIEGEDEDGNTINYLSDATIDLNPLEPHTYTATGFGVCSGYNPTIYKYGKLCYMYIYKVISRFPSPSDTVGSSSYVLFKIPDECKPIDEISVAISQQIQLVNQGTPRGILSGFFTKASTNEWIIAGVTNTLDGSGYANNDRIQGIFIWLSN